GGDNHLAFMDAFKNGTFTLVAGSSWPEDEALLIPYIQTAGARMKFVIAPHQIKEEHVAKIAAALGKGALRYSQLQGRDPSGFQVLILDTIGLLNKVYSYADVAYVGGGFATGLHNTLEPAVHGIPVIIGPRYEEFREAVDLVALGGLFPVADGEALGALLDRFRGEAMARARAGKANRDYIAAHTGATQRVLDHIAALIQ